MAQVSYNRSSKITVYKQITNYSCAATCAGMCVKKSPATLQDDNFDIDYADWSGIGTKYGYSYDTGSSGLSGAIDVLADGYPVIVQVNANDSHFVVITKFSGDDESPAASDFTCADPWTGKTVTLSSATKFSAVGSTRYYYK